MNWVALMMAVMMMMMMRRKAKDIAKKRILHVQSFDDDGLRDNRHMTRQRGEI